MTEAPELRRSRDTVLVVDDDDADRMVIGRALRRVSPGLRIEEVASAREAVSRVVEIRPALVLLDLRMDGIDGFEALARLKSAERTVEAAIVVLSTSAAPEDVREALRLNANAYVQKPASMAEYEELARRLVVFWLETALRP